MVRLFKTWFPFGYDPNGPVGDPETAYSNPDNYFGVAGFFPTKGNCDPDGTEAFL